MVPDLRFEDTTAGHIPVRTLEIPRCPFIWTVDLVKF